MIRVFLHAWGRDDLGSSILREIVTNIIISGLYDDVDKIHVFISGSEEYAAAARILIERSGDKFNIEK